MKHFTISAENAEYQIIQALKNNRNKRAKLHEIFIEGIESIKQALAAKVEITRFLYHDFNALSDWARRVIGENESARCIELSYPLYKGLCDREEPTELLVTARIEPKELHSLSLPGAPFVLIFDRPSDHGNFGTILRSANSFKVDAILLVGHGIDIYDPKVIRSSLGSIFHTAIVPIPSMAELENWIMEQRNKNGMKIVGSDSTGEVSLANNPLHTPISLVLGNEAKGMSIALRRLCDYVVSIPLSGAVNSLNVSCAGSILLWDVYRNSGETFS